MNEKTMNMNLEEFTERVAESVRKKMPQMEIKTVQQKKNNGVSKLGICMEKKKGEDGWSAKPILYLDDIYSKVQKMEQIEMVADKMIECYETKLKKGLDLHHIVDVLDYEKSKSRLYPKLISTKENKELLSDVPHKNILDLSLVYYLRCDSSELGASATSLVTNRQLETWVVDVKQLHRDAFENAKKETIFYPLGSWLALLNEKGMLELRKQFPHIEEIKEIRDADMYVLHNRNGLYGASALFCQNVCDKIADLLKCNFYLIPSSIHEWILVPEREWQGREDSLHELSEMVRTVNREQVDPEEVLSDHAYYYDIQEKAFRW